MLELKIAHLQQKLSAAKIIDGSKIGTDKVQMLNKVKVHNMTTGADMQFTLVGETEADFSQGRLAATTPIGKALMGHSKGDIVEAKVPAGVIKLKILSIEI